jgi:hypothetical protein
VPEDAVDEQWYSVRCVFRCEDDGECDLYEERLTLWQAETIDEALALAESEAKEYAQGENLEYLGLAQGYWLTDRPGHGAEVYSLVRESELGPDDYIDRFFDTGRERERNGDGEP